MIGLGKVMICAAVVILLQRVEAQGRQSRVLHIEIARMHLVIVAVSVLQTVLQCSLVGHWVQYCCDVLLTPAPPVLGPPPPFGAHQMQNLECQQLLKLMEQLLVQSPDAFLAPTRRPYSSLIV
jgi:hypothetical protein